jgi:hypothetical protein
MTPANREHVHELDAIVDNLNGMIRRRCCWKHRVPKGYRFLCLFHFNITICFFMVVCKKNKIIPLHLSYIYSAKRNS